MTSICKFLRKLRIENGEVLKDMADHLHISSSFLSAVENGKKKVPKDFVSKIKGIYSLTETQLVELETAVIESNEIVEINVANASQTNKQLAISFARQFASLDDDTSELIMTALKKGKGNKS